MLYTGSLKVIGYGTTW